MNLFHPQKNKNIIILRQMGVGKQHLSKNLVLIRCFRYHLFSYFSLVNEYENIKKRKVFHFDLSNYQRRRSSDKGIEYFDTMIGVLIEYQKNIENILPLDARACLSILEDQNQNIQQTMSHITFPKCCYHAYAK
jgi:tRNA A37 threonylcarbamoyladenosine biosynthesis protein TsaE